MCIINVHFLNMMHKDSDTKTVTVSYFIKHYNISLMFNCSSLGRNHCELQLVYHQQYLPQCLQHQLLLHHHHTVLRQYGIPKHKTGFI